jgi:hypothetical protein
MKKVIGILAICLGWGFSGFLAYATTIGSVYTIYGGAVLDSKGSGAQDPIIISIMCASFIFYSLFYLLNFLPYISIKTGLANGLKTDGLENYELRYFNWKSENNQMYLEFIHKKLGTEMRRNRNVEDQK